MQQKVKIITNHIHITTLDKYTQKQKRVIRLFNQNSRVITQDNFGEADVVVSF